MTDLLLIFIKNPQLGKVKTRLAHTVGNDEALKIYKRLLELTRAATLGTTARRWLFYSDFVEKRDGWRAADFEKKVQTGDDLGERMKNAFQKAFAAGARQVVIIGSDCPEISPKILREAFEKLKNGAAEVVIGPAPDGGYYLLGTSSFFPQIFENIEWSTERVLPKTLQIAEKFGKNVHLLPELSDVDTEEDWSRFVIQEESYFVIQEESDRQTLLCQIPPE